MVFCYYGETGGKLKTRISEHKKVFSLYDHNAKQACVRYPVIAWTLVMSKSMSKLDSRKFRKSECCFLEALLSTKDLNAGNDPIPNPLV